MHLHRIKAAIKQRLSSSILGFLYRRNLIADFTPEIGKVNWGDLKRNKPLSCRFGYDRGGPIDRYYIETFLDLNKLDVKGNVLEIGDNNYTLRFGEDRVKKSDVLHVEPGNPLATYVADLSKADVLPDEYFDCIILTQTLQYIWDIPSAIKHCHRALKQDGVLLITVPGITPLELGKWYNHWLWSFTSNSIRKFFTDESTAVWKNVNIEAKGNVKAATGFLYGMGAGELNKADLDFRDPAFDVIITVRAKK